MQLKKWKPLFYVLTCWVVLKLAAFAFGFGPWPDIAQLALMGGVYPFLIAFSFAMWIGAASHDDFSLGEAVRNAVMASFLIGCVELMLSLILINNSASFVTYVTAVYPLEMNMDIPFLNLVIATWIGGIFLSIPASAFAYLAMGRARKR